MRAFKDIPVPKDLLEQIVNAITYAPPSFPPIKTEITVIQDKQLIKESLPHMINLYDKLIHGLKNPVVKNIIRRNIGQERFRVIKNHIVPMFSIKLPFMKNGTEDAITRNAQAMILFHANRQSDNYNADIYIALANALLKAHTLGLGATAIDLIPPAIERTPILKQMFKIPNFAFRVDLGIAVFIYSLLITLVISFVEIGWHVIKLAGENPAEVIRYE